MLIPAVVAFFPFCVEYVVAVLQAVERQTVPRAGKKARHYYFSGAVRFCLLSQ